MTHVHYKFSSKRSYDTVVFDGPHVTLKELKRLIMGKERLRAADCDLQITNAQTKEEYADDVGLISKGSSVIVKRIPLSGVKSGSSKTHSTERLDAQHHHAFGVAKAKDDQASSSALPFFAKMTNLADADVPEADKLKVIMNQSTYDPSSYNKKFGAALPSNYTCYRCGNTGHHIRNCPSSAEKNLEAPPRIKKSTGIPRSFMVEVDDPTIKGAMLTNCGRYAIPAIDREAYAIGKKEKPPFVPQEQPKIVDKEDPVPEELLCLICHDLLSDAVVIPCCGNSYCDDCIRSTLLDSEEHVCPTCSQSDVSPDTLIANKFLRQAVNNFKKERGDSRNPKRNPSASQSLNPTPTPKPAPTPPAFKPGPLTHKVAQQDPLLPLPSADPTLLLSKASRAPPAETSASSPLRNAEARAKRHSDDTAPVSNDDPATDPVQQVLPMIRDPMVKQADSVNPRQPSSASRPCAPPACWESSPSSSVCPPGGWTESAAQQQQQQPPPPTSSSSSYSAIPPPLFPSPHFPMYLSAQQPLSTYSPGYPPATPVWTLPSPQSAPIPSLCSSTAASPIPALMSKEWLRHQRMKKERSPHRESSSRRSSSNSGSSKAKSSRSYSRSSSRSRSRSRSRSKGKSRAHSPYSRPRVPHTRSHSSRSYSYGYKRSPTPSSSSSPQVGHHSKSRSQSDHRKSRHHGRKSTSGGHGSVRWRAERSPTPERGPHAAPAPAPSPASLEVSADQYLQWKQQYKEWYDKYFSSYVSHFQQLPPSPFTLPPPPPSDQWVEKPRSHGRRSSSRDRRSPPSRSSSDSRSSPSRSSSDSRSPPSHLSSDPGSTPSKGGALQPSRTKESKEADGDQPEDPEATRKHEEGEIEEELPAPAPDEAGGASQGAHLLQERVETSGKTHERKGKGERGLERARGSRRNKESDSRQDKAKTLREAKREDRDRRANHKSSKSSHSSSERRRKREREATAEEESVKQPKTEAPNDGVGEPPPQTDGEKRQAEGERETEASPLQEGEIWEGGIKVKPQKKISININLKTTWTERTEQQDPSHSAGVTDEPQEASEVAGVDENPPQPGETEIPAEEEKEPAADEKPADEEAKEIWGEGALMEDEGEACENIQGEAAAEEEKEKEERHESDVDFWIRDVRGAEEEDVTGDGIGEAEGKEEDAREAYSGEAEKESEPTEEQMEGEEGRTTEGDNAMMSQWCRSENTKASSPSMSDSGNAGKCEESRSVAETPEESTHNSENTLPALQESPPTWRSEEPQQDGGESHSPPVAPSPLSAGGEATQEAEEETPTLADIKRLWAKIEESQEAVALVPPSGSDQSDTALNMDDSREGRMWMESDRKGQEESEREKENFRCVAPEPKSDLPSSTLSSSSSSASHDAARTDGEDARTESRIEQNPEETRTVERLQPNARGKGGEENNRDAARHDASLSTPGHFDTRARDPRVDGHASWARPQATGALRTDRRHPGSQQAAAAAAAASTSSSKHDQAQKNTGKRESREQQWKRYKLDQLMKQRGRDGEAEKVAGADAAATSNDDKRGEEKRDKKHKREDAAEAEEDELKKPTKKKREEETSKEADERWSDDEYRLFSVMLS